MTRRSVLLMLCAAALILSACGGTATPTTSAPTSAPAAPAATTAPAAPAATAAPAAPAATTAPAAAAPTAAPAASGEAVTINFLMCCGDTDVVPYQKVVDAWKASGDPMANNVTVTFEAVPFPELFPKIETAVAAGTVLDLFMADGPDIKHYAYNKAIVPLDKYFTKEELAQFLPQNVEAGTYKGVFYSPGTLESCSLMFYNKDMTDEAGVKPPENVLQGWTIQQAKPNWQKLIKVDASGNQTQWGLRWGQDGFSGAFGDYEAGIIRRSAGAKGSPTNMGVAPDGITFHGYMDTPEAIKSYEEWRSWFTGKATIMQKEAQSNTFASKITAFYISPDNEIGTINRQFPDGSFHYGVTGIPYMEGGTQLCHTDSWHYGVSPQSKHIDISAALIKFMTGPVGGKIYWELNRQLPARIDLLNSLPEYTKPPQQLFAQAAQKIGMPRIQTPGYTEYQQVFNAFLTDVAQTDAPIDQLVTDAVSKVEAAVAKYKGWDQ
jgi:fructooligosaccharide transport system substrate-binding protein